MPTFPVQRDHDTAAFFDGTARGEFLLVQDTSTGEYLAPQFDTSVDSDRYQRVAASGRGTVESWSVIHERGADSETTRRVVGIVQLDEGPWWWTEFVGANPDADLGGARVQVDFWKADGQEAIPFFRLIEGEGK